MIRFSHILRIFFLLCCMGDVEASVPLILLGDHWAEPRTGTATGIKRSCNVGFTHLHSYSTEGDARYTRDVSLALNSVLHFSRSVKENCPSLKLLLGVPRVWVLNADFDSISSYVRQVESSGIDFEYWYSDELMYAATNSGFSLDIAKKNALSTVSIVTANSIRPYVWVEPGNYGRRFSEILDALLDLPVSILAFDEYVVSRYGRLVDNIDRFNSTLKTLRKLQSRGVSVFPVLEIGQPNKLHLIPNEMEIALFSLSYLLSGAGGLIFYEERWANDDSFVALKSLFPVIKKLDAVGFKNFHCESNACDSWVANLPDRDILVRFNLSRSPLGFVPPGGASVLWEKNYSDHVLPPMSVLVYEVVK